MSLSNGHAGGAQPVLPSGPKSASESAPAPSWLQKPLATLLALLGALLGSTILTISGVNSRVDGVEREQRDQRRLLDRIDNRLNDLHRQQPPWWPPQPGQAPKAPGPGAQAPAPLALTFCALVTDDRDEELSRFPSYQVAAEQRDRYREHRAWLVRQKRLYGWHGGRYDAWIDSSDRAVAYWDTLWDVRWTGADPHLLEDLIGAERYLAGWHPPLIPEGTYPAPAAPTFPGVLGGANNAAGD